MAKASAASKYSEITLTKDRDGEEIKVQLEGKTVEFNYYESIMSPNITANMVIMDTGYSARYNKKYDKQERVGSIYNALPLTGREKLKLPVEWLQSEDMKLKNNSLDLIIIMGSLEHVTDVNIVMKKIEKAIKKNGITKFITPIEENQSQSFEKASILIFLK